MSFFGRSFSSSNINRKAPARVRGGGLRSTRVRGVFERRTGAPPNAANLLPGRGPVVANCGQSVARMLPNVARAPGDGAGQRIENIGKSGASRRGWRKKGAERRPLPAPDRCFRAVFGDPSGRGRGLRHRVAIVGRRSNGQWESAFRRGAGGAPDQPPTVRGRSARPALAAGWRAGRPGDRRRAAGSPRRRRGSGRDRR